MSGCIINVTLSTCLNHECVIQKGPGRIEQMDFSCPAAWPRDPPDPERGLHTPIHPCAAPARVFAAARAFFAHHFTEELYEPNQSRKEHPQAQSAPRTQSGGPGKAGYGQKRTGKVRPQGGAARRSPPGGERPPQALLQPHPPAPAKAEDRPRRRAHAHHSPGRPWRGGQEHHPV